jgi:hypothetical protein
MLFASIWIAIFCAAPAWSQAAASRSAASIAVEIERISGSQSPPFKQYALVFNRELQRAPRFSYQFAVDGWAGGDEPYVAARLEGCRRIDGDRHGALVCAGLGAYHDLRFGGLSPVASASAEANWFRGRMTSFALFERAFTAPTFTYYHADASVKLGQWRRWRFSAGILSRTIQRTGGKVAIEFASKAQVFASAGSGRATVGASFRF